MRPLVITRLQRAIRMVCYATISLLRAGTEARMLRMGVLSVSLGSLNMGSDPLGLEVQELRADNYCHVQVKRQIQLRPS